LKLLPGAAIIFITGLLDDFVTLKPRVKLIGQIAAAGAVFAAGLRIETLAGISIPFWLSLPTTIFWLLLTINALNLIDGLDGLCGGMGFLAAMTLFAVGMIRNIPALMYTTLPLAGALLGFLFYNVNPATVFLGDSGALLIGFLLGCSGLIWAKSATSLAGIAVPLLALSVPLLDLSLSVIRRFLKKQPIFSADRGHIHHRMLDHAFSPRRAALALYLMAVPGLALAVLLSYPMSGTKHGAAAVIFCLIAAGGIWQLRYAEFEMAGSLLFRGEFREVLAGKVRGKQLAAELARADSEEDWWKALVASGRDEGWIRLAWTGCQTPKEQVLSARTPSWSFHDALNDDESVLVQGDVQPGHPCIDLVVFSETLKKTFPANRREWQQPAFS
jgi:UDP-GlcNAc:undecaprenyl-phosphate/decaprenyl-phosphate GlcNAc-1-phosphate transferase